MPFSHMLTLAVLQDLTEFLPICVCAHLVLTPHPLGWSDHDLVFDVAVYVGMLAAVILYFRVELGRMANQWLVCARGTGPEARLAGIFSQGPGRGRATQPPDDRLGHDRFGSFLGVAGHGGAVRPPRARQARPAYRPVFQRAKPGLVSRTTRAHDMSPWTRCSIALGVAALILAAGAARAAKPTLAPPQLDGHMAEVFVRCARQAAREYGVPVQILSGIARVEGGRPGTVRTDRNGTRDYGVMQVNEVWLAKLKRQLGITRRDLNRQVCPNVVAAAYILAKYHGTYGDWWQAVEAYHAGYGLTAGVSYAVRVMRFALNNGFDPPQGSSR